MNDNNGYLTRVIIAYENDEHIYYDLEKLLMKIMRNGNRISVFSVIH